MDARSMIAHQTKDGIEAICCQKNGAPDQQLPVLLKHYGTKAAVAALMALGDLIELGSELGRKHDVTGHAKAPETKNWCLAYGRDQGDDEDVAARTYSSLDKFLAGSVDYWTDFVYVLRDGRWFYRHVRHGEGWCEA
jgi:hypothetical protein